MQRVEQTVVGATRKVEEFLEKHGSTLLKTSATIGELIRRPELDYDMLFEIDENRPELSKEVRDQVNIEI